MSESTVKMRSLTIQEKLEVIEMIENGKSIKDVTEETGINRNSLHYILKNRNKIREEVSKNPTLSKHKRIKQTKNPELETSILNYIFEARENGEKLTGNIIKSVALETSVKMNIKNFAASNGWLFSFFKRNGISISDFNSKLNTTTKHIGATAEPNIQSTDIAYEYNVEEIQETDTIEECTEPTIDWRNWCKFCGSTENTETITSLDESVYDLFQKNIKLNVNYDVRSCEKCKTSFEELQRFLSRGKIVNSMFDELEEEESSNLLTDDRIYAIRAQYLWEECISEDTEQLNSPENEIQEVYEEDYLEETVNDFDEIQPYEVIEEMSTDICESFENEEKSKTLQDEELYVYNCHMCSETFERMCFLSNHTRQIHNCLPQVACSCGKYLATWDSLMAHKRKHSDEPAEFFCETCHASFQTKTGLSIHIKFKHNKKPRTEFICNICNEQFKDIVMLKNHRRTHVDLQLECQYCTKKLSNKYSLKNHISTVHERQKTILCHLCTKGFSTKSNLRSHLVSHTTELVECNICNQVFKNKISLQSHKKIHKPKEQLNFACTQCDKRFHNRNHLERHTISHSNEKNYRCSYEGCCSAYKWEKDLKNHESTHDGLKRHLCQFCPRGFVDIANLRKHKLKQHPEELSEYELKIEIPTDLM
ncbi:hypothetical protein ACKWTF_000560 [Chironomus riparius]